MHAHFEDLQTQYLAQCGVGDAGGGPAEPPPGLPGGVRSGPPPRGKRGRTVAVVADGDASSRDAQHPMRLFSQEIETVCAPPLPLPSPSHARLCAHTLLNTASTPAHPSAQSPQLAPVDRLAPPTTLTRPSMHMHRPAPIMAPALRGPLVGGRGLATARLPLRHRRRSPVAFRWLLHACASPYPTRRPTPRGPPNSPPCPTAANGMQTVRAAAAAAPTVVEPHRARQRKCSARATASSTLGTSSRPQPRCASPSLALPHRSIPAPAERAARRQRGSSAGSPHCRASPGGRACRARGVRIPTAAC